MVTIPFLQQSTGGGLNRGQGIGLALMGLGQGLQAVSRGQQANLMPLIAMAGQMREENRQQQQAEAWQTYLADVAKTNPAMADQIKAIGALGPQVGGPQLNRILKKTKPDVRNVGNRLVQVNQDGTAQEIFNAPTTPQIHSAGRQVLSVNPETNEVKVLATAPPSIAEQAQLANAQSEAASRAEAERRFDALLGTTEQAQPAGGGGLTLLEQNLGYSLTDAEKTQLRAAGPEGMGETIGKINKDRAARRTAFNSDVLRAVQPFDTIINEGRRIIDIAQGEVDPARQIEVLYRFIRALDAESVVREGEVALAQQAVSLQGRLEQAYQQVSTGAVLPPDLTRDILGNIYELAQNAEKSRSRVIENRAGLAANQGLTGFDPGAFAIEPLGEFPQQPELPGQPTNLPEPAGAPAPNAAPVGTFGADASTSAPARGPRRRRWVPGQGMTEIW